MPSASITGGEIHYSQEGSGRPLVLLHAFPVDQRMWSNQLDRLSTHWRVITPDFAGFGTSPGKGAFTVASLADDIREFLKAINALPCALAGCSMGGYAAMNFAAKYPDDLLALILVDTKDAGDTSEQRDNRNRMIDTVRAKGSKAIAELMIGKMLAPDTMQKRLDLVKTLRSMMESCPPLTVEHALAALRDRPDMADFLPAIATPTLIIVGESDSITPPAVAETMKSRIPGAQLSVIKGAGHMSPMEQPTLVNKIIRQFLESKSL